MNDNNLKLLNWNVRGLNSTARRETVRLLIQQAKPHIICLQETKLSQIDDLSAIEFLGQTLWSLEYLPANSTRGGIVIAWDTDLVAAGQPVIKDYSVTMELTMKLTNSTFLNPNHSSIWANRTQCKAGFPCRASELSTSCRHALVMLGGLQPHLCSPG